MPDFSHVLALCCVTCGKSYVFEGAVTTCPICGPIAGTLDVLYNLAAIKAEVDPASLRTRTEPTIWRYHELLPVSDPKAVVPIPLGLTPLYPLEVNLGLPTKIRLLVKDDTRHPTGSAKDRASAVGVAHARSIGAAAVAAASTGNAASSVAAFAARAALPCYIFAPAAAPPAKLAQIQAHGAHLLAVEGTYDEAFDLCASACLQFGFYSRNSATNPMLGEGKKTAALEIFEQLGGRVPDAVFVPVGDGCIIGGVYKGFLDLLQLGWSDRLPRLVGVQADGSAALTTAWREGKDRCRPAPAVSVADSICVSVPRDQVKALRAVRRSNGAFIAVSDDAILDALSLLATRAGILVEPAAAAPLAGLKVALEQGLIREDEEVVLLHTGHGLKDIDSMRRASSWNQAHRIGPDLREVERILPELAARGRL
jgi:threonine synthase